MQFSIRNLSPRRPVALLSSIRLASLSLLGLGLLLLPSVSHATLILDDLNNGGVNARYSGGQNGARNLLADELVLSSVSGLNSYNVAGYGEDVFTSPVNLTSIPFTIDLFAADSSGRYNDLNSPTFSSAVTPTFTQGFGTSASGSTVSKVSVSLAGIVGLQNLSAGKYLISLETRGTSAYFYRITSPNSLPNDYVDNPQLPGWTSTTSYYGSGYTFGSQLDITANPVPEPSSWAVLGLGAFILRRRMAKATRGTR